MQMRNGTPFFAALALVACGGGESDESGTGGETVAMSEAAEMMQDAVQPEPGQYRTSIEVRNFSIDGLPDAQAAQMEQMMSGQVATRNTFCLTPEEAEEGPERMVEEMASGDCVFDRFDYSGGSLAADMRCTGEGGVEGSYHLEGEMTAQSSDMQMAIDQKLPGMADGRMRMEMHVRSDRVGDCS